MEVHPMRIQQLNCELLVSPCRGYPNSYAPATFGLKAAADFLRGQLMVEFGKIPPRPRNDLLLECVPLLQKSRYRQLHRRIYGKIGVGNDFKPRERSTFPLLRTADDQPRSLHLRQPGNLREPAQGK